MNDKTILIIEDDLSIQNFLRLALKTKGYKTIISDKGLPGISIFMSNNPDIILLDLGLPDIDGIQVLDQIRQLSDIPIIIISARGQEREKVNALDLGADDYITKPFNIEELLARIRVAIRRYKPQDNKNIEFTIDNLKIDFDKRHVYVKGVELLKNLVIHAVLNLINGFPKLHLTKRGIAIPEGLL